MNNNCLGSNSGNNKNNTKNLDNTHMMGNITYNNKLADTHNNQQKDNRFRKHPDYSNIAPVDNNIHGILVESNIHYSHSIAGTTRCTMAENNIQHNRRQSLQETIQIM